MSTEDPIVIVSAKRTAIGNLGGTLGALAMNHAGFHSADGSGYDLMADWLIRLDGKNPQTAARQCSAFQTWRRYDVPRQAKMRAALERIASKQGLSRDVGEMVSRMLA